MLEKLEYLSASPTGIMDRKTHAALSKFQSDNRLIATGDLNYDTYEHLRQKIYGYTVNGRVRHTKQPIKHKPNGTQIKLSAQSKHKVGDLFKVNIHTNNDGYLTCFHQSDSGPVTQILPQQSNVRLQVTADTNRTLPNKQDSFRLKFEETGVAEHVLCTLQDFSTATLFSKQAKPFATISVRDITHLPQHFIKTANLKDWAIISRSASP